LQALLQALRDRDTSTLVFCGEGFPEELIEDFASERMAFCHTPLSLEAVAAEADLAINHASSGTSGQLVLLGVPQLCLPMHQEQYFVALRMKILGNAVLALFNQDDYGAEIDEVLGDQSFRLKAQELQHSYRSFRWQDSLLKIEQDIVALLP